MSRSSCRFRFCRAIIFHFTRAHVAQLHASLFAFSLHRANNLRWFLTNSILLAIFAASHKFSYRWLSLATQCSSHQAPKVCACSCSGPCSLPVARICLFSPYRLILSVLFGFRHNSTMSCYYMVQDGTILLWLSLFHAPARLYYCPSRQFIHMDYSFSSLWRHFS